MSFEEFLQSRGFPADGLAEAEDCLADRRKIDGTLLEALEERFMEYMDGDYTHASVARMITSQGYETVNHSNSYIETILNGRYTFITLDDSADVWPEGRRRVVALGAWNVHRADGIDRYPFFAAGLMKSIDPMFNKRPEL